MTAADRRRQRATALRLHAEQLEHELADVRAALRRAELAAVVTLHRGRGIQAPECPACTLPARLHRRSPGWTCPRCGAPVERVEATQ
jgi:hypothetical protein